MSCCFLANDKGAARDLLSFLGKLGALLIWLLSDYEALLLFFQEVSLLEAKSFIYPHLLQTSPT